MPGCHSCARQTILRTQNWVCFSAPRSGPFFGPPIVSRIRGPKNGIDFGAAKWHQILGHVCTPGLHRNATSRCRITDLPGVPRGGVHGKAAPPNQKRKTRHLLTHLWQRWLATNTQFAINALPPPASSGCKHTSGAITNDATRRWLATHHRSHAVLRVSKAPP